MQATIAQAPALPWWRRRPTSLSGMLLYLLAMAPVSGVFSVLLNRLLTGEFAWSHFVSGAIIGTVINGITLALHHRPAHAAHV